MTKLDKTRSPGADETPEPPSAHERAEEAREWVDYGHYRANPGVSETIHEALDLWEQSQLTCADIIEKSGGVEVILQRMAADPAFTEQPQPSSSDGETDEPDARFAEEWPLIADTACYGSDTLSRQLARLARQLWGDLRKLHGIQGDILTSFDKLAERVEYVNREAEGHNYRLQMLEAAQNPQGRGP